jgi:integrase
MQASRQELRQKLTGHASAEMNAQYTHLSTDDLRNAMQRLPDLTSG